MGLLPHAQPFALDCGAQNRGRSAAGHRRVASAIHAADQFPREMARLFVAGPIRFLRHGRTAPASGRAVRGVESRAGEVGGQPGRVALEQRAGAPVGPQRRLGQGRPLAGDGRRLNGLLNSAIREEELTELRSHVSTGRPLGDEAFLDRLEAIAGRVLKPQKGGRPKKQRN